MRVTMHVSLLSNEQRTTLIQLMQAELELIGYDEQAVIDEIISNGLVGRLCDLEELISLNIIKEIAS
ncbi:hypothetical protein CSV77_15445 [Sporosarcina sp. P16b]|uniref:hypothetical protein n=1 Tax=Sporosarcina sp. P16b TaxID=2048261 RepID=UPI000C169203|nr:hypothetical protein [Sporosarcina sp. P16b]PIC69084.1 hypothetical protein CSV77_15445 [Sporosarcina sp. P16b]